MRILILLLFFSLVQCSHSKPADQSTQDSSDQSDQGYGEDPNDGNDVGDKPDPVVKNYRFGIISDMNGSYGSKSYSRDVKNAVGFITDETSKIDFVISTGDMVAGQKSGLDYRGMWEAFHSSVTRPMIKSEIPIFPSPGNHDAHIGRQTERKHYEESWEKEDPLSVAKNMQMVEGVEQNFPFQYAFRVGAALFISVDDTAVKAWSDSTLSWMEDVLEKESDAKLRFVYGHVPILPFAFKKETEYASRGNLTFLRKIENLFDKYKVDVFFSGHSHVYYPGRRDRHTEYVSVPLLGSGSRYHISRKSGLARSPKAFLVVEFDSKGNWSLVQRESDNFEVLDDELFPEVIDMPSGNTSKCQRCSQFPSSHFLDSSERIIYRRHDL